MNIYSLLKNIIKRATPPVGAVVCMNTNTNPSTIYGGTWTLIDKEFSSQMDYVAENFTKAANITSVTNPVISRDGHSLTLKLTFVNTNALTGSNVDVGTWNMTKCGVSGLGGITHEFMGFAEGYGVIMMDLASSTAKLRSIDTISRTGTVSGSTSTNNSVAAGSSCYAEITMTIPYTYMLDAACDKFYFKRTA